MSMKEALDKKGHIPGLAEPPLLTEEAEGLMLETLQ